MHISGQTANTSLYSPQGRRKYLTPPERLRFIAAAMEHPRPEVRTLCLVLAYTGCRISEALGLFSASIEADEAFIAIRSLKKRKKAFLIRQVPVPLPLIQMLQQVHPHAGDGIRLWTWSRSRAWQLVKAIMADAQIPPGLHATPKGLRHGFGVHAVRNGIPLNLVQRYALAVCFRLINPMASARPSTLSHSVHSPKVQMIALNLSEHRNAV